MIQLVLFLVVLMGLSFVLGISAIKSLTLASPHKGLDQQVQIPVLLFALLQVVHHIAPGNSFLMNYKELFNHVSWVIIISEFYFYPKYICKSLQLSFRISPLLIILMVASQIGYIFSIQYHFQDTLFIILGYILAIILIAVERCSSPAINNASTKVKRRFVRQFTFLGAALGIHLLFLSSMNLLSVSLPHWIEVTPFMLFSLALLHFGADAYVQEFKILRKADASRNTLKTFSTHYDLTKREQEVLETLFQVKENKKIASQLNISLHTVKTHMQNIYRKTATSGKTELTHLIYEFNSVETAA